MIPSPFVVFKSSKHYFTKLDLATFSIFLLAHLVPMTPFETRPRRRAPGVIGI
jgi:hypothetical protein